MRVVHIITRLVIGGAQENTLITCREQKNDGYEVFLITGDDQRGEGTLINTALEWGIEVIPMPRLVRQVRPITDLICLFQLKRTLRELAPDIIHTHSAKAGILGRAAGYPLKGKLDSGLRRPLLVHGVHGLPFHEYQSRLVNMLYIHLERFFARRTDAFICVANTMTEKSLAAGIGTADMYTTAYSAMDVDTFLNAPPTEDIAKFRSSHNIAPDAKVIVKVARLAELKGHDYVIESAKQLAGEFPDCIWLFVGSGLLEGRLRTMISEAGLSDRFRFTGLLRPEDIPLAIHSSDILLHCSLREGLARVLPQAMLCAKPVISFDIDGAKEVVNDDTGYLLVPGDVSGIVNSCRALLSDENLCRQKGDAGRESVREMFTPRRMVDTIEGVYRRIL